MNGGPFLSDYVVHVLQKLLILKLVAIAEVHVVIQEAHDRSDSLIALQLVEQLLLGYLIKYLYLTLRLPHNLHKLDQAYKLLQRALPVSGLDELPLQSGGKSLLITRRGEVPVRLYHAIKLLKLRNICPGHVVAQLRVQLVIDGRPKVLDKGALILPIK